MHPIIWCVFLVFILLWLIIITFCCRCSLYDFYLRATGDEKSTVTLFHSIVKTRHTDIIYDRLRNSNVSHYDGEGHCRGRQCEVCFCVLPLRCHWSRIDGDYYHTTCVEPIVMRYVIDRCILLEGMGLIVKDVTLLIVSQLYDIMMSMRRRRTTLFKKKRQIII